MPSRWICHTGTDAAMASFVSLPTGPLRLFFYVQSLSLAVSTTPFSCCLPWSPNASVVSYPTTDPCPHFPQHRSSSRLLTQVSSTALRPLRAQALTVAATSSSCWGAQLCAALQDSGKQRSTLLVSHSATASNRPVVLSITALQQNRFLPLISLHELFRQLKPSLQGTWTATLAPQPKHVISIAQGTLQHTLLTGSCRCPQPGQCSSAVAHWRGSLIALAHCPHPRMLPLQLGAPHTTPPPHISDYAISIMRCDKILGNF